MSIENRTLSSIFKKAYHHILIILVLAFLTYLSWYDNHKDISKTYLTWTIIYTVIVTMSLLRQKK